MALPAQTRLGVLPGVSGPLDPDLERFRAAWEALSPELRPAALRVVGLAPEGPR